MSSDVPPVPVPRVDPATRAIVALSAAEVEKFLPGELAAQLRGLLPSAVWCDPAKTTAGQWRELIDAGSPAVVVTAWQSHRLPDTATGIRYVCHLTGSLRGVMPRTLLAAGVRATNWGGIAAPLVAEHALLLTLAALRVIARWGPFLATPSSSYEDVNALATRSLRDRRVAIHGFGQVAREFIKLLVPFGCDVVAYSPGVPDAFYHHHGVQPAESLEALAAASDVFVTCEALTERTRGSIGRAVLAQLPVGAVFVNVGRGAIVDEAALAEIAIERRLRIASDVFVVEPLPVDSPLRGVPNAIFSPHIAGPTLDWFPRCGAEAVENVGRYLRGERLSNQVTLELYDRAT